MHARAFVIAFVVLLATHAHATVKVITTTQDPAAITRAIGGDRVEVKALAKGFQDPHFLDAKPTFMVDLRNADLLEFIGLDLEVGYLASLVAGSHNDKVRPGEAGSLDLSQFITPLDAVATADRSQGDIHPTGNPHYWLDPENGRLMARGIAARLSLLDPEGKATYERNLAAFEKVLTEKQAAWSGALAKLKGSSIITFHKSWPYFAQRFGLNVVGFVEPKPGIQPTPQHTLELIRLAEAKGVKVILMENFYDDRFPRLIQSKSAAKVAMLPNSVGGIETVKTYFDLFDAIVAGVVKAAGG